jgi:hypothetical protein
MKIIWKVNSFEIPDELREEYLIFESNKAKLVYIKEKEIEEIKKY